MSESFRIAPDPKNCLLTGKGLQKNTEKAEVNGGAEKKTYDILPGSFSQFAPENKPGPKRKGSSSNHHFSGAMLNFQGVVWIDGGV